MGLKTNTKKTTYMVVIHEPDKFINASLRHEESPIYSVKRFTYRGTWLVTTGRPIQKENVTQRVLNTVQTLTWTSELDL